MAKNLEGIRDEVVAYKSYYNLINHLSIIACGVRRTRSCAAAYLLTGAQHTLRAGIIHDDRELFRQIIQVKEHKT